jgi:hypothetical protein
LWKSGSPVDFPTCLERMFLMDDDVIVILGTQYVHLYRRNASHCMCYDGATVDTSESVVRAYAFPSHCGRAIYCIVSAYKLAIAISEPGCTLGMDTYAMHRNIIPSINDFYRPPLATVTPNGGGPELDITTHGTVITDYITDVGMYCEPQERRYCGAHALNALAGRRITTGQQMVAFFQQTWPDGANAYGGVPYYEPCGNFCASAINRWMWTHTCQPVTLVKFLSNITDNIRYSKRELLSFLPDDCGGIFVWFKHNDATPHFKCIKQLPGTNTWYSLDSLKAGINGKAIPMVSDAQWYELHGEFYFAAFVDALEYQQIDGYVPRGMQKSLPSDTRTLQVAHLEFIDFSSLSVRQVPLHPRLQQPNHVVRTSATNGTHASCGPAKLHLGVSGDSLDHRPKTNQGDKNAKPQQQTAKTSKPSKTSIPQVVPTNTKELNITKEGEPATRTRSTLAHAKRMAPQRDPPPIPAGKRHAQQSILPFLIKRNTTISDKDTIGCERTPRVQDPCETHVEIEADRATIPADCGSKATTKLTKTAVTVLTWNVMGLTTVGDELMDIITRHQPDVVVLTETKLTQRSSGKGVSTHPTICFQCGAHHSTA